MLLLWLSQYLNLLQTALHQRVHLLNLPMCRNVICKLCDIMRKGKFFILGQVSSWWLCLNWSIWSQHSWKIAYRLWSKRRYQSVSWWNCPQWYINKNYECIQWMWSVVLPMDYNQKCTEHQKNNDDIKSKKREWERKKLLWEMSSLQFDSRTW